MSGVEVIFCPECGHLYESRDGALQQIDIAQARVMLQFVPDKETVLDQWKLMGFIQDEI